MVGDTRRRILDEARILFNVRGLHRVGVREIADASEMRVGNLGYYFATKDDLVAALWMELHQLDRPLDRALRGEPLSLRTLYRAIRVHMRDTLHYRGLLLERMEAPVA